MSAADGGPGVQGGPPRGFVMRHSGRGGAEAHLGTAAGAAQAEASPSSAQLRPLEGATAVTGFERAGDLLAPRDGQEARREPGISGPSSITAGRSGTDAELAERVFVANGVPDPYNSNTTEKLAAQLEGLPELTAAVDACTAMAENPTAASRGETVSRLQALEAVHPGCNITEVLFLVFRESIRQTNEDKKYFLSKLQELNTMAEQVSDYLSELIEASQDLSAQCENKDEPEKEHIRVDVKTFDLTGLGPEGELATTSVTTKRLETTGLNETIKDVESMQESIRNKREMASTSFQNFDQKANQLYTLMSSVLKAVNEMRAGTVRNML